VGWYPSQAAGPPSAGPFAAPATPARRGIGRFGGVGAFARGARPNTGGPPAWRNRRGALANVLLFGLGPLVLVGVVVAAFLLVSPGKGTAASSLGFQAGPGATAQPSTTSAPAAAPSSPAPGKRHTRPTPSAAVAKVPTISRTEPKAKAKAKATPRPAARSGGGVVAPRDLGLPNFAGYCQHIGDRTAELTADDAYGWHCTLDSGRVLQLADVCAWTYHLSASQVVGVSANYSDPNAWQCWRISRDLGVLNVAAYCVAAHLGSSELVADNAYGWYCTSPLAPVNTTAACDTVYHVSDAVSRFAVFADPYSWQCWD